MLDTKKMTVLTVILTIGIVLAILFAVSWVNANGLDVETGGKTMEYEAVLFGQSVLGIEIKADEADWQEMLDNAISEEYITCDVTIAGQTFYGVGIRPKGNTSLSSVVSSDSDRYSFKLKFDYTYSEQTCFGLDTLVINNMHADYTYMKEYISYDLMQFMGVDSALATFADLSVNGSQWGLYLAVELYRDSFLTRTYGTTDGQLYNVKSTELGGGAMMAANTADTTAFGTQTAVSDDTAQPDGGMPDFSGGMPSFDNASGLPDMDEPDGSESSGRSGRMGGGGRMGSGSGGDLVYSDDNASSYSAIFSNAVSNAADETDYARVIAAIKAINEAGNDLEDYLDVDQALRYFAVHTFVVNLDSYISNMQQNYYLYEKNGQVSILPWDYNLAFGGFQSGTAEAAVNFPIDTPVSGVSVSDRPLLAALLENEEYLALYHQYLNKIVTEYFDSGYFSVKIAQMAAKIDGYVQTDPTAFCDYETYLEALETFITFCNLRAESVKGQLNGTIPSTSDGQTADSSSLVSAEGISLSTMGTQGGGGGMQGGRGGNTQSGDSTQENFQAPSDADNEDLQMQTPPELDGEMPDISGMEPPDFDSDSSGFGQGGPGGNQFGEFRAGDSDTEDGTKAGDQTRGTQAQNTAGSGTILLICLAILGGGVAAAALWRRRI